MFIFITAIDTNEMEKRDNMALITIVVPVYKVPLDMLHRCLDSIASQTSKNFEAILIDDGSPDNCGLVCDEYVRKYGNYRVIHQKNGGLSVVRNKGIMEATGEWVCFVDGDDWIEPKTIEFAEHYIDECADGDVLIWDEYYDIGNIVKENCFIKNHSDGKLFSFIGKDKAKLFDMFFPVVFKHFEGNFVDIGTANARLYNRNFLIKNNLFNVPGLKRMQDNVFNLWVFEKADKIYYQCKRLYHYVFNESAATQKYDPGNVKTMEFLYQCMHRYVQECHNTDEYYQRLYSRFIRIFGEIFKLNYANPNNPNGISTRIEAAEKDFSSDSFKEVVDGFRPETHGRKTRLIHYLLLKKKYFLLIIYYFLSIKTRRFRLLLRRN